MTLVLDPMWLTGFCEAESCFHVSFTKRLYRKIKVEVQPSFSITQRSPSKLLLLEIENYFHCGAVRYAKKDGCFRYEVRSLSDLCEKILPHFDQYPFRGPKKGDFRVFKTLCCRMQARHHQDPETLKTIIDLAFELNQYTRHHKRTYTKDELYKLISKVKV